ncbi:MAG: extracellular solute-binding protein [Pseudomonadota bacterium]
MLRPFALAATFCALGAAALAESHDVTTSHGISAFGALKYPADFPHFDYVNPDAPKGGFISFRGTLASSTFDSLNYYILDGEPAQGLERIYDTLLARAWDEPDAAYGYLAESIEFPEDRSWVIFNLRPEARFSDGEPVTAEDVVFTIEAIKADGSPRFQIFISDIEGGEVLGEHRVKINFVEGAETRDLIGTAGTLFVLPKHYYETVDFSRSTLEPPVGSGPYLIDDVNPGRSITYCLNPDYWGADLPVNVGTFNFECVTYEYFADRTAAFEALKAGEYVFHEEFFSALWATAYDFPALEEGWVIRDTLDDGRAAGAQGFWMNTRRPHLSDPLVREAIGLAFNFEWSNETLFYGLYNRTDSFWESTAMEASGVPEGAELALLEPFRDQLPETVFNEPAFTPLISGPDNADRSALRRAGRLLEEAGWQVGDDGLRRNAAGEILEIEFVDDGPVFERIVLPYIENLERIGIKSEFVLLDRAQMQLRQEEFDYDIIPARLNLPLTPSVELRAVFGSESADASGTLNLSGVDDPVIDALIQNALAAKTREDLDIAVRAIDRVLRAEHIWVPQWFKGTHWIAYWDMFGRPDIKPPYVRGEDYWWFEQEKYDRLIDIGALR